VPLAVGLRWVGTPMAGVPTGCGGDPDALGSHRVRSSGAMVRDVPAMNGRLLRGLAGSRWEVDGDEVWRGNVHTTTGWAL